MFCSYCIFTIKWWWQWWVSIFYSFVSFYQFDTNGDGQISTAELREAMKKLLGQQVLLLGESVLLFVKFSIIHGVCLNLVCLLHLCILPRDIHTSPTIWLFQVGHRDLEDILRDIDLNGDGHVDFEGMWRRTLQFIPHNTFLCLQSLETGLHNILLCWCVSISIILTLY